MGIKEEDLIEGDYYIHPNHGIGQYKGIEYLDFDGLKDQKCYLLVYADEGKLYIPSEQIDLIEGYHGPCGLSTLGGKKNWRYEYDKNLKIAEVLTNTERAQSQIEAYKNILKGRIENNKMLLEQWSKKVIVMLKNLIILLNLFFKILLIQKDILKMLKLIMNLVLRQLLLITEYQIQMKCLK